MGEPLIALNMFEIVTLLCSKCQHPLLHEQYWLIIFQTTENYCYSVIIQYMLV